MSDQGDADVDHDDAQQLLMEAVSHVAKVQNGYGGLSEEQEEMLEDGKSSIAAVSLDLEGVEFDL